MEGKTRTKANKDVQKLRTLFYAIISVVVVILLVIIAAQKLGNVTVNTMTASVKAYLMSMGSGDGYPYEIDEGSVKGITVNSSNLMLLLDDKTMLLTPTAKEIMPKEHNFSNPIMKARGSHIIVFDLDSGKLRVQNAAEILREEKLENRIMAGGIGAKGNYAVATYDNEAQSALTVYNASGKSVYKWIFRSEFVSDIALSDNGKYAAVSAFSSKNGKINSKLYVFNLSSDKYEQCFDYPSTMLLKVSYLNGMNISVIGDSIYSYIKDGKDRHDNVQFGSDTLHNCCFASNGASAFVLSRYSSTSLSGLYVYDGKNKKQFTLELDKAVKSLDTDGKHTAVLFENEVRTYNKHGKQIGSITFSGEPKRVVVDGSKTYVLTSTSLQCFKTKGTQKAE